MTRTFAQTAWTNLQGVGVFMICIGTSLVLPAALIAMGVQSL
ncbi:MAG: hypothetical protein AB7J28_01655 [Hyphomonadaceae bacterium]